MPVIKSPTVADFFAGIGLVSMGLQRAGWKTVYALDYDKDKAAAYTNHFGDGHYHIRDIAKTKGTEIPAVTLAHASFPCTELSVAGARRGIHKGESSSFWHFPRILREMKRLPPFVLLENVEGLLTPDEDDGLRSILEKLNELGYYVDLLRIDASHFVPQSRVRLFMVGTHESVVDKLKLNGSAGAREIEASSVRPQKIVNYISKNSDLKWYFHKLPALPVRRSSLKDIIDHKAEWWSADRALYLYNQTHKRQREVIDQKKKSSTYKYFTAFRRMRMRDGESRSTAEIRMDGIAGCLRTPKGGSAKQIIVRVGRGRFDARLLNEKEVARLMGANQYRINPRLSLNQVLFGFGDAVCVPALEWIGKHYLNPLRRRL